MDEQQLAELEMHIAAGTDLPTAMAAVGDDQPPKSGSWFPWAFALGVVLIALWLFW